MSRSIRGSTQPGVRWKTVIAATRGWMAGTIWTAEAPVPMTATRWPDRSASWSQRAEWQIVPRNRSSPSMPGLAGSDRLPEQSMIASADSSRVVVRICQHCRACCQLAASTSSPNSVTSSMRRRRATCRE